MTAILTETAEPAEPAQAITARAVALRPALRREPPFDDELTEARQPRLRVVRSGEQPLPFEPVPSGPRPGRLGQQQPWTAPQVCGRAQLPDPAIWARRLLVALLETQAGQRPLRQLVSYVSPSVHAGLSLEFGRHLGSAEPAPSTLRSVRVFEPADGVAEVSAVIRSGSRYRAIAARLEGLDGRWCCMRLQVG